MLPRIPHLTPTLSAPRGAEGDFHLPADRFQHPLHIFHNVPVPEPNQPIAAVPNLKASTLISLSTRGVLSAVELDGERRRRTCEADKVFADRVLTAKAMRKREFVSLAPQPPLGLRHVPPQAPGP